MLCTFAYTRASTQITGGWVEAEIICPHCRLGRFLLNQSVAIRATILFILSLHALPSIHRNASSARPPPLSKTVGLLSHPNIIYSR